jgi:hypothetical protein
MGIFPYEIEKFEIRSTKPGNNIGFRGTQILRIFKIFLSCIYLEESAAL